MKKIIGITGATSVGKSSVAIQLAKRLHSEIVSADSMQIYRGMDIGTAKITREEMQGVIHHMIDVVNPNEEYSSYLYQSQASKIIDGMDAIPIAVGGTGFYFDSLLYPPEFGNAQPSRRAELQKIYSEQGLSVLCKMLEELDSDTYNSIDLRNPIRVIRAIEIAESGGRRCAGSNSFRTPRYDMRLFVLDCPRDVLYERIDRRVDKMISDGLFQEVKRLFAEYGECNTSAFSAIGYKEIIECLQGKITLEEAADKIKLNTRHYAKRQISYFKRMNVHKFIDVSARSTESICDEIYGELQDFI